MVTIHDINATEYNSLGLGALLPSSCVVTEELNGCYELEMTHPYDEGGKWKRIEEGRVIFASTPKGKQPFRIYRVRPDMDRIEINARHIFYDLLDNWCGKISLNSATATVVITSIRAVLNYPMPFIFSTDIAATGSFVTTGANPVQLLIGSGSNDVSFYSVFGGELKRDGIHVSMLKSIGQDRDVAIRYGKNLTGLEVSEDISGVKTRIVGSNNVTSVVVDSPYIDLYPYPKIHGFFDASKFSVGLEQEARAILESGCDLPTVNIKVNFVELTKTEEYKDYAVLEEVFLGDMVTVVNSKMGFHKKAKVISYKWNCLLNRYDEVELGDFLPSLASSVTSGAQAQAAASNVAAILNDHINDFNDPHHTGGGGDSGDHVEKTGDTMTGPLVVHHEDGFYVERTKDYDGTYKVQFSAAGGNKIALHQWLNDVYMGGAYFSSGYLQVVDANKVGYRVFAENYLPTPEQIGAALKNHTHDGYADANHTHSGYAESGHTHDGFVSKNGDRMSGTLTVEHKDGVYIERTEDYDGVFKSQLSNSGGNKVVLNRWLKGEYLGGVYFGSDFIQIVKADGTTCKVFAENFLPTLEDLGAAASDHTHDGRYYTESEVDAKLSGKADSGHSHTPAQAGVTQAWMDTNHAHDKQNIKPSAIELTPTGTGVNNGGYLDFHYNQDTSDYTSRIIEAAKGRVDILASAGVRFNGHLYKSANDGYWAILGGTSSTNGANMYLYGKDSSSDAGAFMVKAVKGSTNSVLKGTPDGELTWKSSALWGGHNKPNGTYTGNGSATARTISVGGTGSMLLIYYASFVVFVGSGGGMFFNFYDGSSGKFTSSEVKLSGGTLTIASTSQFLNQSSRGYGYILL